MSINTENETKQSNSNFKTKKQENIYKSSVKDDTNSNPSIDSRISELSSFHL